MLTSNTLHFNTSGGVVYLTFPGFERAGGVRHAFSTRLGGVSRGNCASMSFGFSLGDDRKAVLENYRLFCDAFGADCKKAVLSQQTHTANLRIVTADDAGKGIFRERDYSDIDGLITNVPGIVLVTQYADCTPLAFYDPVKRVVATSHAGWRGTAKEIAARTVERMGESFGCDPKDILCGIGVNIGKCCYEVDDPVIEELNKLSYLDRDRCFTAKGGGKYMLDLKEVNREILVHSGIRPENIEVADLCTCCHSDLFHSHRATGGKRGTLAMMISLE